MGRRRTSDCTPVLFEAASNEVVKQIGRKSLHPLSDLNLCNQYELFQVIQIKRFLRPWKQAEYQPLNMKLQQVLKNSDVPVKITKSKTPVTILSRTSRSNFGCISGEAEAVGMISIGGRTTSCSRKKILCELGPLQSEKIEDLVELQRWAERLMVDYKDSVNRTIKTMKDDYLNKNKLQSLCVVTSVYKLMEDGKLAQVESASLSAGAHASADIYGMPANASFGAEHGRDMENHDNLNLPKGTIIAYGVNELILDNTGRVAIIQDTHTKGKFMRDLHETDPGIQESFLGMDEDEIVPESELYGLLSDGLRGLLRELIRSPDLDTVCEINDSREKEMEVVKEMCTRKLGCATKQLLVEMGMDVRDDHVKLSKITGQSTRVRALCFVISAIDELRDEQLLAIISLTESEAVVAIDKVLREKLFIHPACVKQLPSELYSTAGQEMLREFSFEMTGEGVVLVDNAAEQVQCELIGARILITALYDMPRGCGAVTPLEWGFAAGPSFF